MVTQALDSLFDSGASRDHARGAHGPIRDNILTPGSDLPTPQNFADRTRPSPNHRCHIHGQLCIQPVRWPTSSAHVNHEFSSPLDELRWGDFLHPVAYYGHFASRGNDDEQRSAASNAQAPPRQGEATDMPFIANTPESLIGWSDSKNVSTTCRGITSSGRSCRRPIATGGAAPSLASRMKFGKLRVDDPRDESLYCWQHKEQATLSARSSPGPRVSATPIIEERTSLDTLADRLGLLEAEQRRSEKPQKSNDKSSSSGAPQANGGKQQRPPQMSRPKPQKELSFCFCFRIPIEEVPSPGPRPRPRPLQATASATSPSHGWRQSSRPPTSSASQPRLRPPLPGQSSGKNSRHSSNPSNSSQTAEYLSLISPTTSPQTVSLLMAELAKPLSQLDEPGYIYMFWLTPESQPSTPPAEAARSLLTPPSEHRPGGQRRPSDVLASFAAATADSTSTCGSSSSRVRRSKVLLKIGRATNVQRRLNEWTRQCGYNLSLIRYYPYIPSASPAAVPRKMPHSHKVERLIHLELAGLGLRVADREKCGACGREHREWFEVGATRKAVADVDEVVRRWVEWDESNVGLT